MKMIFVVDDSDTNLITVETALEDNFKVMTMSSAAKMFSLLEKMIPDIILLDIDMPNMDGFTTLKILKSKSLWSDIPVIFLTGRSDDEVEAYGFEIGAIDFIVKPFSNSVLLNRIKTHLNIDKLIREKTTQLNKVQNCIVSVLSEMVENRDKGGSGHIERTTEYIKLLINELIAQNIYMDEMYGWNVDKIVSAARMHDLGKITITDLIINKPGHLTPEEYDEMKKHAIEGERIIDEIIARTGNVEFLQNAKIFAGSHHERWDGKGYPRGLKEKNIPLHGRLMAVVDTYDALVSERPYKKPFTDSEAMQILKEMSGKNYDPVLVDAFYNIRDQIIKVREDIIDKPF